jgi:hypothetical protein
MDTTRRVRVLHKQLADGALASEAVLRSPCAAGFVDPHTMECFLDNMRSVKLAVYEAFSRRLELLVPHTEGLTHHEHRQLVRDCLHTILGAGFEPLTFFDKDIRKYIYMAEVCAPIDLSLVLLPSLVSSAPLLRRPTCLSLSNPL